MSLSAVFTYMAK